MSTFEIRPYQAADEAGLLDLWNLALDRDQINAPVWRTQVLLDSNFRRDGLLVAEAGDRLVGFALAVARQVPLDGEGLEPERGWITAFAVHPAHRQLGIGRALLDAAAMWLGTQGRREIWIAPYTPNYFTPGIDLDAYPSAVTLLQRLGWQTTSTPIAMWADLSAFAIPPAISETGTRLEQSGITVRSVRASDLPDLLQFIRQEFGWDWHRFARQYLLELFGPGSDQISFWVALQRDRLVGYCQQRRERFGPFGVLPELRKQGIGRLLLFRCLAAMPAQGFRCAWFLWTGRDAARLYALAGFRPWRQFAVMQRIL